MSKIINTRIKQKIDTFDNWMDTSVAGQRGNLIALEGEFIVYKSDASNIQPKIKVGDGVTRVYDLPFLASNLIKNALSIPFAQGKLEYNGSSLSPSWMNYDSTKMNLAGQTSGIDAGTYTALFTPKDGYCWADGSTSTIEVEWVIDKKKTGLLVVPNKLAFSAPTSGNPKELRVYSETQLTINVESSTYGAVDVSLAGSYNTPSTDSNYAKYKYYNLYNISWYGQGVGNGITLTFSASDNNYDCSVTCDVIYKTLESYTWQEISDIAASGNAANMFSIGDTKSIILNGTVPDGYTGESFNNKTVWVYILDFDYYQDNRITFGCFRFRRTDIMAHMCLASWYTNSGSGLYNYTTYNSNSELDSLRPICWQNSTMRYQVLGSTNSPFVSAPSTTPSNPIGLMACLPPDLRAVLKPIKLVEWGQAGGDLTDYLPIRSQEECLGSNCFAYYGAGNPYTHYTDHSMYQNASFDSAGYISVKQWYRSKPDSSTVPMFYSENGLTNSTISLGLAPLFDV